MRPYTVQLHVSRSRDESLRGDQFDLELVDLELTSTSERAGVGTSFLDLRAQDIRGLGLSVKEFLVSFLRGDGGTQEDGLRFGQRLLRCLLADKEVGALWNGITERRRAERRPLRLELLLPEDEAGLVSDIPFELLADETGFLFRQIGSTLVRAIRRMPVRAVEIAAGHPHLDHLRIADSRSSPRPAARIAGLDVRRDAAYHRRRHACSSHRRTPSSIDCECLALGASPNAA
jgi:hypothetical protein